MATRRRGLLLGLLCGVIATAAGGAEPATVLSADIAPRPLPEALAAFGRQTGLQLIYVSEVAETRQSKGAQAGVTVADALTQLLDGTGLRFEFLNSRTVRIFPASTVVPTLSASSYGPQHQAERPAPSHIRGLEEVVVTGTRGQEVLSRVPVDMAVWTAEAMELSGVKGIAQIGALTPGMDYGFSPIGADFYTHLDIRGVTNRGGATVGVYIDDVPISPTRAATYSLTFPVTFDLDRVEVLRGPQTVLLGDHAQSGAIRFVTNQPSLTDFTGHVRAEWGTTEYGTPSYEAGAAVGGPVVDDVLGFRVSGWFREDGGYVDRTDPNTGATLEPNANRYTTGAVRAALRFALTPAVELTPSVYYQSLRVSDQSTFVTSISDPARGIFKGPSNLAEPIEDNYLLASLKLAGRLGAADVTALASYFDQSLAVALNGFTVPPVPYMNDNFGLKARVYSAEVRLSSPDPSASLSWVGGIFAATEHIHNPWWRADGSYDDMAVHRSELDAFGQLTLKLTESLSASAGVRVGRSEHHDVSVESPVLYASLTDTWSAPRFSLSWQIDDNNLLYTTIAKGYGSGGVYPLNPVAFLPDTLRSYEIGSKHDLLNHRLRFQAAVFHIAWNNRLAASGLDTTTIIDKLSQQEHDDLPGSAVSDGFDLATQALIAAHTKAALEVGYVNVHLTQDSEVDGVLLARSGAHLPVSPVNVTASLEQEFPLPGNLTASARLEDAFRGSPSSTYLNDPTIPNHPFYLQPHPGPSANILNVRAAVKWPSLEVAAYLRNALNSHPLLTGIANGVDNGDAASTQQVFTLVPRTLSISATWRY